MLFKKAIQLSSISIVILTVARIFLKVTDIDSFTGFYSIDNSLGLSFNAIIFAVALACFILSLRGVGKVDIVIKSDTMLEWLMVLTGGIILLMNIVQLYKAVMLEMVQLVNTTPKAMQIFTNALGCAAAVVLMAMALGFHLCTRKNPMIAIAVLIPAIWQAAYTVTRYLSFRFTTTASDQLLETMFLVCATGFLFYYATCVSGVNPNYNRCVAFGLTASIFGLVVSVGHVVALFVLGGEISGANIYESVLILSLSVYAIFTCCKISRGVTPKSQETL